MLDWKTEVLTVHRGLSYTEKERLHVKLQALRHWERRKTRMVQVGNVLLSVLFIVLFWVILAVVWGHPWYH